MRPIHLALALTLIELSACYPPDVHDSRPRQNIQVLDGDTVVFEGKWVRIRGIDAAELGPWAKCWSEAALGGASRAALIDLLEEGEGWRLVGATPTDDKGMIVADVQGRDGEDLAEDMAVDGYAARTSSKWDWCTSPPLAEAREDDPLPRGPNTWWPANQMFDARAGD